MAKSTPFKIHVDPSCLSEDTDKENSMPTERVTSSETVTEDEIKKGLHTSETLEAGEDGDIHKREDEARDGRIEKIEAEIRAAARAVITSIEQENYDNEDSVLSTHTDESYTNHASYIAHDEGIEDESYQSDHDHNSVQNSEGAGDSSSHHDGDVDDDVFSHSTRSSARSSLNSCHDLHSTDENQKLLTSPVVGEEAASSNENEPISRVPSGSSYARPEVDNQRTPSKVLARPPFRTPSAIRAMQMSSPTQSLFSSPRSSKRHMPTVSRLGTPTSHSSPSKRTPTRFKVKKEYPLVLLHVTVLPLQWSYSRLMSSKVPESLQDVKESWRLLQDKLGDTVLERGVLLAHPQDSYEVLEERLLEALELPVRPRAQILKCGHYMGPSDFEVPSSDEEVVDSWIVEKKDGRSWCDICARNVRLEDASQVGGPEKRFRIKIYASNGLMRAGAWAAAWREMERVDVEIEPFVESSLHAELEHLASITPVVEQTVKLDEDDSFVDEEMDIPHVHDHEHAAQEKHEEEVRLREEEVRSRMAEEEEMRQRMADEEHLRQLKIAEENEMRQKMADEEHLRQLRIAEEEETRKRMANEEHLRKLRIAEEEEARQRIEQEERMKIAQMAEELGTRQRRDDEEKMKRKMIEEKHMREIYGQQAQHSRSPLSRSDSRGDEEIYGQLLHDSQSSRRPPSRSNVRGDESLSELLLAAFQVAMRDSKNIAILVLSAMVLFMALKPSSKVQHPEIFGMPDSAPTPQVTTTLFMEAPSAILSASTETSISSASLVPEPTAIVVTETVAVSQITTTVFKEAPSAILQPLVETSVMSASLGPEPSAIVITETVAMPQITTTVFKERTVTEVVPASTVSAEALSKVVHIEEGRTALVFEHEAAVKIPSVVSEAADTIEIVIDRSPTSEASKAVQAAVKEPPVFSEPRAETTMLETEMESSFEAGVAEVREIQAPITNLPHEETSDAIAQGRAEEDDAEVSFERPKSFTLPAMNDYTKELHEKTFNEGDSEGSSGYYCEKICL